MFTNLFKKKTKFQQEFTTRDLSLELEPGWVEYREGEDAQGFPTSFIKEKDGQGALQVSFATNKDPKVSTKEELFKSKEGINNIKEYKLREWTVYEFEESTKELYNKSLFLVKQHIIVYVTWYGSFETKGSKELKEAIKIAHSIQITSKN